MTNDLETGLKSAINVFEEDIYSRFNILDLLVYFKLRNG